MTNILVYIPIQYKSLLFQADKINFIYTFHDENTIIIHSDAIQSGSITLKCFEYELFKDPIDIKEKIVVIFNKVKFIKEIKKQQKDDFKSFMTDKSQLDEYDKILSQCSENIHNIQIQRSFNIFFVNEGKELIDTIKHIINGLNYLKTKLFCNYIKKPKNYITNKSDLIRLFLTQIPNLRQDVLDGIVNHFSSLKMLFNTNLESLSSIEFLDVNGTKKKLDKETSKNIIQHIIKNS